MKKFYSFLILFFLPLGVFAQSYALGDVNHSGNIDINDGLLIARYTAGLAPTNFYIAEADVNCSGGVDINDALVVARYSAGLATICNPVTPTPTPAQNPIWTGGPYTLNGTNSIDLPDGLTNNLNDFTVACWVNLSAVTNWVRIFDFGGDSNVFMMLTPASGTTGFPYFAITTTGNAGEQGLNGTSALPMGSWQHLAVVKSGDTGILYINKQEVGRNNSMTLRPADLGNTSNNYIGKSQWANDPLLNASISNFVVYARALSTAEITVLGNNIPTPIPTPSATATPTRTPTPTPTPTPTGNYSAYVYLGFDDGPISNSPTLVNNLKSAGAQATMFVWGNRISSNSSAWTAYLNSGFSLQNHSWTHSHMTSWSYQQVYNDLQQCSQAIQNAGKPKPTKIRLPYLESNSTIQQACSALGLSVVNTTVDTQDWNGASTSSIVSACNSLQANGCPLMHDGYSTTNAAISQIVANLKNRGLGTAQY